MQDDINKDDELDFDDFDDSDITDLDEIDDEALDTFDDEDLMDEDELGAIEPGVPAEPSQKSFIQKNFNLLVFGGVALIGAGLAYGFLMSPPAPQPVAPEQQDQALAPIDELQEGVPPMPTPMDSAAAPEDSAPPDVLTPMPGFDEPAPIDTMEMTENEMVEPALETHANDFLAAEAPLFEEQPELAPESVEEVVPELNLSAEDFPVADAPLAPDMPEMPATNAPIAPEPVDAFLSPEEVQIPEMDQAIPPLEAEMAPPAETMPVPDMAEIDAAPPPVSPESTEKLDAALAENQTLNTSLEKANSDIQNLNAEITSLQDRIRALEEQNQTLQRENETAQEAASAAPPAPPTPKPAAQPQAKPETPKPTPSANTTAITWVLKSAQPGRAVIAPRNGNDMMRISVGDTVPGLGTIQSISKDSQGRWVVIGSSGSVFQ